MIRAISQDPKMYPEPERFLPERFLGSNNASLPMDPRCLVFGYGRQICLGIDFADMNIFLTVSAVLATSTISNTLDDTGRRIIPDVRSTGGPLRHVPLPYIQSTSDIAHPPLTLSSSRFSFVKPFQCNIKPRSAAAEVLIRECGLA